MFHYSVVRCLYISALIRLQISLIDIAYTLEARVCGNHIPCSFPSLRQRKFNTATN